MAHSAPIAHNAGYNGPDPDAIIFDLESIYGSAGIHSAEEKVEMRSGLALFNTHPSNLFVNRDEVFKDITAFIHNEFPFLGANHDDEPSAEDVYSANSHDVPRPSIITGLALETLVRAAEAFLVSTFQVAGTFTYYMEVGFPDKGTPDSKVDIGDMVVSGTVYRYIAAACLHEEGNCTVTTIPKHLGHAIISDFKRGIDAHQIAKADSYKLVFNQAVARAQAQQLPPTRKLSEEEEDGSDGVQKPVTKRKRSDSISRASKGRGSGGRNRSTKARSRNGPSKDKPSREQKPAKVGGKKTSVIPVEDDLDSGSQANEGAFEDD